MAWPDGMPHPPKGMRWKTEETTLTEPRLVLQRKNRFRWTEVGEWFIILHTRYGHIEAEEAVIYSAERILEDLATKEWIQAEANKALEYGDD